MVKYVLSIPRILFRKLNGQFNDGADTDGGFARIKTSKKNGFFGSNDDTNSAPEGPVGNGIFGFSMVPNASGVFGANNNGGTGVWGNSEKGDGVIGTTQSNLKNGIVGRNDGRDTGSPGAGNGILGSSAVPNASGVMGVNDSADANGVLGMSKNGRGLHGISDNNIGIFARGGQFGGLFVGGGTGDGVFGSTSFHEKNGIVGRNDSANDPLGKPGGNGVFGFSKNPKASGVFGAGEGQTVGVWGNSENGPGIKGTGKLAGRFEGDVEVTGDIRLTNMDCAEEFSLSSADTTEPGTVMVINKEGNLEQSHRPYDKKVAGIVSGAGTYKPAIILGKEENAHDNTRLPIALMGKVYCKVDARNFSIEIGDLLTTSFTKGHAMKAQDPYNSFGAVIGKALGSIKQGMGMIPVLVALQ